MRRFPSVRIVRRLADEVEYAGEVGLLPSINASEIAEALRGGRRGVIVQLVVPRTVKCKPRTNLTELHLLRCLGRDSAVLDASTHRDLIKRPVHSCGGTVVPAPVWIISSRGIPPNRRVLYTSQEARIMLSAESYCHLSLRRSPCRLEKLWIQNMSRPIANLRIKVAGLPGSREVSVVQRLGPFQYLLTLIPNERITRPISITAFYYDPKTAKKVELRGELPGVEEVYLCEDLEVIQATVGYKVGHPRESNASRITVLDYDRDHRVYRIPVRWIKTKGLVIKVDRQYVRDILGTDTSTLWRALHTLCHAFLSPLPGVAGLDARDFGEALSMRHFEFAVFDNSPGGLGGVEGVVNPRTGVLNRHYELRIIDAKNCPLRCMRACIACLYSESCYMLNWNLDRTILLKLGW